MITYSNANNDAVWELIGLSTDEKPTEKIPNGSTFHEMDTGITLMFDAESKSWFKQPETSSSGSSSGGSTDSGDSSGGGTGSGDSSGSGSSDEEIPGDVATDEEVEDTLGDIFG